MALPAGKKLSVRVKGEDEFLLMRELAPKSMPVLFRPHMEPRWKYQERR